MQFHGRIVFIIAAAHALSGGPGRAQEIVEPAGGFTARDRLLLPTSTFLGGIAYTPEGDPVIYDHGSSEIRIVEDPSPRPIATFGAGTIGSFLAARPDGTGLLFAEGLEGNIHDVPWSGEGPRLIDRVANAYQVAFDGEGRGFVSALATLSRVVLVDSDPEGENLEVITGIPGFSGPLAFDPPGNLYYGVSDGSKLVRFTPAQLEAALAGSPLPFEEGEPLLEDAGGFFDLKWSGGRLYYTDLGFSSSAPGIYVIDPATGFEISGLATLHGAETLISPGFIALRPGPRPFEAGEGPGGGSLLFSYSDFTTVNNIAELEPEVWFVRGRVNEDDSVDISDALALLDHLFAGASGSDPVDSSDLNDDGSVDISDPIYLLEFLFRSGRPIPSPYPERGPDPTPP